MKYFKGWGISRGGVLYLKGGVFREDSTPFFTSFAVVR